MKDTTKPITLKVRLPPYKNTTTKLLTKHIIYCILYYGLFPMVDVPP